MQKIFVCLFFLFCFILPVSFAQDEKIEDGWLIRKGTHFLIHYQDEIDSGSVGSFLKKSENYYNEITRKLGFRRFNFWTWDNRCKIYLYFYKEDYYNKTGQPSWAPATAYVKEKTIYVARVDDASLETILPHEMGHLIFREFVGYETPLPLWLDEGIATFVEEEKGRRLAFARKIINTVDFIPLEQLTNIIQGNLERPDIFYAEAASLIEFLLSQYGKDKFIQYCRSLRDRKHWGKALEDIYSFKTFDDMNNAWVDWLKQ